MDRKIFAFDLDGTLLIDHSYILPATIKAIKKAKQKGHIVAIATGRPYVFVKNLGEDVKLFDFWICNNGTYFYDYKKQEFNVDNFVPKEIIKNMIELGKKDQACFIINTLEETFSTILNDNPHYLWDPSLITQSWEGVKNVDFEHIMQIIKTSNITQASLLAPNNLIKKFKHVLEKRIYNVDIHIAGDIYLDINPKGTNKLLAIKKLCTINKIDLNKTVAFGDSGNDLQMLKGVGLGFCMENGTIEAKKAAKEIIGSNTTNAIAKKILELI